MSSTTQVSERTAEREQKFANYPDNSLGKVYREFKDTPSLYSVLLDHFRDETK